MIELNQISYRYQTFTKEQGFWGTLKDFKKREISEVSAVKDFSLKVDQGQIIGLIGPNGAGKTSLIKIMTGILEPSSGEITCNGYRPFDKNNQYLKSIGVILGQKSQLIWDLPAFETLDMLRIIYEIDEKTFQKRLNEMVDLLNVKDKLYMPVRKLSLGERVKFEIICSLIHSPDILFLDEPTIGLDITSQKSIHEFLLRMNQEENTTIILTSHYMKDIEILCDRLVIIINGQKAEDTTVRELTDKIQIEEEYILTLSVPIPSELSHYIQLDDYSITLPKSQLKRVLKQVDGTQISSIVTNRPKFEQVIFDIFSEGGH